MNNINLFGNNGQVFLLFDLSQKFCEFRQNFRNFRNLMPAKINPRNVSTALFSSSYVFLDKNVDSTFTETGKKISQFTMSNVAKNLRKKKNSE